MKVRLCFATAGLCLFSAASTLLAQHQPNVMIFHSDERTVSSAAEKQLLERCRRLSFQRIPYKFGGSSMSGMDCSASIQHVLKQAGVRLPRTADAQANRMAQRGWLWRAGAGETEAMIFARLRPGALIFWAKKDKPNKISHVMMFIGMEGQNKARLWGAQRTGASGINGSGVDYYHYTVDSKTRRTKIAAYGHAGLD